MHMAIEMNNRTKILAGVVGLAAVGAAAWFFFLDDFLNEPPPKTAAATSAPAGAAKQADAAKPAADAPKPSDAAKPVADAPKQAAAANPGAKPIPTNPDQLVAEVIESSGVKSYFIAFAREAANRAGGGDPSANPAAYATVVASVDKAFESTAFAAEVAANLKANGYDAERMARFLELLRQPISVKMTAPGIREVTPEAMKEHTSGLRKNPLPAARVKQLQTLDEATKTTDLGAEMMGALFRDMFDTALDTLKKGGRDVPPDAKQIVGGQMNSLRNQGRILARAVMYVTYRKASDEDLAEYVKLLDTDTGRWGSELLANAIRPALLIRASAVAREVAPLATARAMAKETAAPQPVARQEEKPAEKPAVAAPTAPVEAPGYRRPANIRDVYTRYNDVISATVMRDRAAVRELLDDGKNPNARQKDGFTPLMIAVANGDADIASMLLAKGADPNLRASGRSALSMAKARPSAGMVQLLERSGAKD
jgi:Ankyrin repeats (3 copies)